MVSIPEKQPETEAEVLSVLRTLETAPTGEEIPEAEIISKESVTHVIPLFIKIIDVDVKPKEISRATFYITRATIEGEFGVEVTNTGLLPLLSATLKDMEKVKGIKLYEETKKLGFLAPRKKTIQVFKFKVSGWNVVRALWQYFLTKTIETECTARVSDITFFAKDFKIRARIPVRKLEVKR